MSVIDVSCWSPPESSPTETEEIAISDLARLSVTVGIPCYNNIWCAEFGQNLIELCCLLATNEVPFVISQSPYSLIAFARNLIASKVLKEGDSNSRLLFIDTDSGFDPADVVAMLHYDRDVIGLPYAPKLLDWEAVHAAVLKGATAEDLPFVASSVTNTAWRGERGQLTNEPFEVDRIGTGTMAIKWNVLDRIAKARPELEYRISPRLHELWNMTTAFDFFATGKNEKTGYYEGEDWAFCDQWRRLGGKIWCLPARTEHHGRHSFKCDLGVKGRLGIPL